MIGAGPCGGYPQPTVSWGPKDRTTRKCAAGYADSRAGFAKPPPKTAELCGELDAFFEYVQAQSSMDSHLGNFGLAPAKSSVLQRPVSPLRSRESSPSARSRGEELAF